MSAASTDIVDVIVIGAGPAGENVAKYVQEGGLTALLVESGLVGGECSYHACMPSKALLRPLEQADLTAHLQGLSPARPLPDELLARRDAWVSHYDDAGQVAWAEGAGIPVVRGHGRLVGERTVEVTGQGPARTFVARRAVVLATGSEPVVPEIFRDVEPWLSSDATGVVEVPGRLAVVGGGVVACEAVTWMTALGSRVTMLVRGEHLLGGFEPEVGEAVESALRARGVDVRLGTAVYEARRSGASATGLGRVHGGEVRLLLDGEELAFDEVLVATGRRPRHDGLGLESLGLTSEDISRGGLPQWLHAIGDAGPGTPLTHAGKYQARVLGARLAGRDEIPPPAVVPVPQVVFTDPQAASVGLTEQAARAQGLDVITSRVPFGSAAGAALLRDDVTGFAKLTVDLRRGTLLGATFVGPEAGELLHAATIAIVAQVPVGLLRHAVPAYPTASELWLRLLEQLPVDLR